MFHRNYAYETPYEAKTPQAIAFEEDAVADVAEQPEEDTEGNEVIQDLDITNYDNRDAGESTVDLKTEDGDEDEGDDDTSEYDTIWGFNKYVFYTGATVVIAGTLYGGYKLIDYLTKNKK